MHARKKLTVITFALLFFSTSLLANLANRTVTIHNQLDKPIEIYSQTKEPTSLKKRVTISEGETYQVLFADKTPWWRVSVQVGSDSSSNVTFEWSDSHLSYVAQKTREANDNGFFKHRIEQLANDDFNIYIIPSRFSSTQTPTDSSLTFGPPYWP